MDGISLDAWVNRLQDAADEEDDVHDAADDAGGNAQWLQQRPIGCMSVSRGSNRSMDGREGAMDDDDDLMTSGGGESDMGGGSYPSGGRFGSLNVLSNAATVADFGAIGLPVVVGSVGAGESSLQLKQAQEMIQQLIDENLGLREKRDKLEALLVQKV